MRGDQDGATKIVALMSRGDIDSTEKLFALVYDDLRARASRLISGERSNHTLQPTALVHEAYLRLVDQISAEFTDRAHFLAVAAGAMHRVLVDHARGKNTSKRGGGWSRIPLESARLFVDDRSLDILELDEALSRLGQLSERQAQVVELKFFGGMTIAETASVLEVAEATVVTDWRLARAWLRRELSRASGGPDGERPAV